MKYRSTIVIVALLLLLSSCSSPPQFAEDAGTADTMTVDAPPSGGECSEGPGEVYETRIRPLIENDRPSSCSKCHAAGVNLGAFVTGDPCGSMQCLVSQGLVDLDNPTESALLTFISRGYNAPEETGVTAELVREEYTGFLEWIEWAARCMDQSCTQPSACGARPETPLNDAGDTDDEPPPPPLNLSSYPCGDAHQIQRFYDHAYPPQGRCGHCHAEGGAIPGVADAPLWLARNRTLVGAEQTIRNLYGLGAINLDTPRKSRVLLKPLHPDAGGIKHGGGAKFPDTNDELYIALLTWIQMQQECRISPDYPPDLEFDDDRK